MLTILSKLAIDHDTAILHSFFHGDSVFNAWSYVTLNKYDHYKFYVVR